MRIRRFAVAAIVIATSTAGVMVACSFPELTFAPTDGSPQSDSPVTNPDGSPQDGGTDGALPIDVEPDASKIEAGLEDVQVVDAAGGCCDCDLDTYLPNDADASCAVAPKGDCDDLIKAVRPDAGFVLNDTWLSSHTPAFDWNCDSTVTKQLNHDLKCTVGLGSCTGEGFMDDPPCGAEANYFTCGFQGLNCTTSLAGTRTQACK